jgi:hypothetical protein
METYTAICKVEYWDYDEKKLRTDYFAATGITTFTQAMESIEQYYGDDMESVNIQLLDTKFCPLDESTAVSIVEDNLNV